MYINQAEAMCVYTIRHFTGKHDDESPWYVQTRTMIEETKEFIVI